MDPESTDCNLVISGQTVPGENSVGTQLLVGIFDQLPLSPSLTGGGFVCETSRYDPRRCHHTDRAFTSGPRAGDARSLLNA